MDNTEPAETTRKLFTIKNVAHCPVINEFAITFDDRTWSLNFSTKILQASRFSNRDDTVHSLLDTYLNMTVRPKNQEAATVARDQLYYQLDILNKTKISVYAHVGKLKSNTTYLGICNLGVLQRQHPDLLTNGTDLTIIITIGPQVNIQPQAAEIKAKEDVTTNGVKEQDKETKAQDTKEQDMETKEQDKDSKAQDAKEEGAKDQDDKCETNLREQEAKEEVKPPRECKGISNLPKPMTRKLSEATPLESLKGMLDNGILTDVVIRTKQKDLSCHKVVLAASSEVFRAMFENGVKEGTMNHVIVNLLNVYDAATMQDLLHYMYTKETPPNIDHTCTKLLMASDYFRMEALKDLCISKLCGNICVENATELLQLAERYNADALKDATVPFVVEHYQEVMDTPAWRNISDRMSKYLLSTLLRYVGDHMVEK